MLTIGKGRNRRTEYPGLVNPFAYYLSTIDFVLSYVHEFYDIMDAARRYGASGGTKMAYASSAAALRPAIRPKVRAEEWELPGTVIG